MKELISIRQEIYNFFSSSKDCKKFFYNPDNEERLVAYYTSMYLIDDTAESLDWHREKGFSENPLEAYIEFWGVMQAITIQQDAICELYWAIEGKRLNWKKRDDLKAWRQIRKIRNICAGHPAKKDRPKHESIKRTFLRRNFGSYLLIEYEQWKKPKTSRKPTDIFENISHPKVRLGEIIDDYSKEAGDVLNKILQSMRAQWSNTEE